MSKNPRFKVSTVLIVVACVSIPCAPVISGSMKAFSLSREAARWQLAAAANADEEEQRTSRLEKATQWHGDLPELRDYWLFRLKVALRDEPENVGNILVEAIEHNQEYESLVLYISVRLSKQDDLKSAITSLQTLVESANKISLNEEIRANLLNQLSYFRAVVGEDLELALKDIDEAIDMLEEAGKKAPYSLIDTRAWVLHKLGYNFEALAEMDKVFEEVKKYESVGLNKYLESFTIWMKTHDLESDESIGQKEAGEYLWMLGTLHYHRAEILSALAEEFDDEEREKEAKAEYKWLEDRHLPADESLF